MFSIGLIAGSFLETNLLKGLDDDDNNVNFKNGSEFGWKHRINVCVCKMWIPPVADNRRVHVQ